MILISTLRMTFNTSPPRCCVPPAGSRICVLWACLLVLSVTVSCSLRWSVYSDRRFDVSPTDSRIVTLPGVGLFCQDAIMTSNYDFRIGVFTSPPAVDTSLAKRVGYNVNVSDFINPRSLVYWGFYLLRGSAVTVRPCPQRTSPSLSPTQYVVRGSRNLELMMKDMCRDSPCYQHVNNHLSPCGRGGQSNSLHYTFRYSDEYYFLYSGHDPDVGGLLNVEFHLNRSSFYDSKLVQSYNCTANKPCRIPVPVNPGAALVYQAPNVTAFNIKLTVNHSPRPLQYAIFFLLLPLLLGLVLSVLVWCCECKPSDDDTSTETTSPGDGSRQGQTHQEGQGQQQRSGSPVTFWDAPPKYETLVNEVSETAPPPYPGLQAGN